MNPDPRNHSSTFGRAVVMSERDEPTRAFLPEQAPERIEDRADAKNGTFAVLAARHCGQQGYFFQNLIRHRDNRVEVEAAR